MLALDAELAAIDRQLAPLVTATAPRLLEVHGVGVDTDAGSARGGGLTGE